MAKRYAFTDESDWNVGPYCVHGGWIASDPVWQRFEAEWSRVLAARGLAKEGFHSKDFFNRKAAYARRPESKNPYKDWSDQEAAEFIKELTATIVSHKLIPLGCAVDVQAFLSFTIGERRYLTGAAWNPAKMRFEGLGLPKYAYHLSLWGLISHALMNTRNSDTVNFTIDRHQELQSRVTRHYDETRVGPILANEHRNKLGLMSYYMGGKPQPEGLQAADLYAYLWTSWFRYRETMPEERRSVLLDILGSKSISKSEKRMGVYEADNIEHILAESPHRDDIRNAS